MVRRNFPEDFQRRAVDLYESTPGATLKLIGADLGVAPSTLGKWVNKFGTGTTSAAIIVPGVVKNESVQTKVQRLEAELAQLRADKKKLETEKEILHAAAKYFAGETNW
jgi:transposase